MRKTLKISGLVVVAVLAVAVCVLAVTGIPAPPSVTSDGVGRLPWKWAWRTIAVVRALGSASAFESWVPGQEGMLIVTGTNRRVQRLGRPGGEPEDIENLPPNASGVLYPHGSSDYFVYSADAGGGEMYNHFRYDVASGRSVPLTAAPGRHWACCFDPAGERVAYASNRRNGADFDIYVARVLDPASETAIYDSGGEFEPWGWSPDGRTLLARQYVSQTAERLHFIDVATGLPERLLTEWGDTASFEALAWAKDSASVFFASDFDAEFHQLRRYSIVDKSVDTLAPGYAWDVTAIEPTPDGTRLAFLINEDGKESLHVLELSSGTVSRAPGAPEGDIQRIEMHPERNRVALDLAPTSGRTAVWTFDLDTGEWEQWTGSAAETDLPPLEVVRYPSFDSVDGAARQIPAFVFPPAAGADPPWPVLIDIHGGPAMQARSTLNPAYNMLRAFGVAVITPNVRGSTGYGRTYADLDNGPRRLDAVRDVGALLDWVAADGRFDASRVAVSGGSYGGYMVLASLVAYPDKLRCGVDMFGISDFVSFLEASEQGHFPDAQRGEYGDERDPDMRRFLDSISPANHAEDIRAPLLIFQGANDIRVKPEQSRLMVERIRAAGGHVEYIEASDEGHGLTQPLNLLYFGAAFATMMEECVLSPSR